MDAKEQKKLLLPYIQARLQGSYCQSLELLAADSWSPQRAEEVEKVDKKIAYYCRLYAVTQVGCCCSTAENSWLVHS